MVMRPCVRAPRPDISDREEGLRIGPLAELVLELSGFVYQELTVLSQHDARPLERPRRRPLEVDAGLRAEAAAVTGALELLLGSQVVRSTAEMRTRHEQREEAA